MNPYRDQYAPPVKLSFLDRLIYGGREAATVAARKRRGQSTSSRHDEPNDENTPEKKLRKALLRDLEWLFNTRCPVQPPPEGTTQLERSVYSFGLPDVCSMNLSNVPNRDHLAHLMEEAVERFETRLTDVVVRPVKAPAGGLPQLHFTIEGTLQVDPSPLQIQFDAVLEVSEGEYQVRGDLGA